MCLLPSVRNFLYSSHCVCRSSFRATLRAILEAPIPIAAMGPVAIISGGKLPKRQLIPEKWNQTQSVPGQPLSQNKM